FHGRGEVAFGRGDFGHAAPNVTRPRAQRRGALTARGKRWRRQELLQLRAQGLGRFPGNGERGGLLGHGSQRTGASQQKDGERPHAEEGDGGSAGVKRYCEDRRRDREVPRLSMRFSSRSTASRRSATPRTKDSILTRDAMSG